MNWVRLKVPAQNRESGRFVYSSLPELRRWLEGLPRGDAEPLAAAIRDALLEINRGPLRRADRFQVMETLRPAVNDAAAMLVGCYRQSSFPLTEAERTQAELVCQLFAELAVGFKICANEGLEARQRQPAAAAQGLLLPIQRGLLALGRTLVESYRVYAPEPPLLWRDLYALYLNAERLRLTGLPIEASRDSDETALSIKQAFLRVAVLAMANPYHLMQGEAEELYRRVGRWVTFANLRAPAADEELGGKFTLDLGSDLPARYRPRDLKLPPPAEPRLLELSGLVETVDTQIAHANELLRSGPSTLSERMQRDMYLRFRDALGGRSERGAERRPTVARLTLVEGLSACHFFLNGRRPFTPEQDEAQWQRRVSLVAKEPELSLLGDEAPKRARDEKLPGLDRSSRFEGYDVEADDIWGQANRVNLGQGTRRLRRTRYQSSTWNRKNESAGGMALFCAQDCPVQARMGELVAYATDERADSQAWRIGTVRWLRTRPNGGLELGIKNLAESGHAVGTQAIRGTGTGSEYLRGLILPRVNPLVESVTLVTPAAVYDVGTVLRLNLKEVLLHAQLTELIETTQLFSHFRFKIVEAVNPTRRQARR